MESSHGRKCCQGRGHIDFLFFSSSSFYRLIDITVAPKIHISLSVMMENTQSIADKTFPYVVLIHRFQFVFYFDS